MADIVVKTFTRSPDPDWQDGDYLAGFSDRKRMAACARVSWRPYGNPTGQCCSVRAPEGEWTGGGLHEEIMRVFRRGVARVVSATEVEYTYDGFDPFIVGPTPIESPIKLGFT